MGYTYPKTTEEAVARRAELRRRERELNDELGPIEREIRKLDDFIATNQKKICRHCGNGPASYIDGFNGVTNIGGCDGFHCFDCAHRHHGLAFAGVAAS